MPHLLDLPADVLLEIPWNFEDLLSVVHTCRSLNVLLTPKIYEIVEFDGDFDDKSLSEPLMFFLDHCRTSRPGAAGPQAVHVRLV
jgi:hypothetical protein